MYVQPNSDLFGMENSQRTKLSRLPGPLQNCCDGLGCCDTTIHGVQLLPCTQLLQGSTETEAETAALPRATKAFRLPCNLNSSPGTVHIANQVPRRRRKGC